MNWDIRREGRAWSADEVQVRKDSRPEKLEILDGKLLWTEAERIELLGLLLENVGADQVVRMGDPKTWAAAVRSVRTSFFGDRLNRFMLVWFCLHILTTALLMWYLVANPRPAGRLGEILLGVALGLLISLGVNLYLRD
jgi:hypothetical protein